MQVPCRGLLHQKLCPGNHIHQHAESSIDWNGKSVKRSTLAGRYLEELCNQIASSLRSAQDQAQQARDTRVSGKLM